MKTLLTLLAGILILVSCKSKSGNTTTDDDSLQYYPPTPKKLSREEFRLLYREVSSFFDTTLLDKGFNGGLLIAKDGDVIYERYSGFTDLRTKKDSINPNTAMHVASTSKTFTGVAVLRMIQQGKLSLDDTVGKFFPGFPYNGVTVKMLLTHRSGLPNYLYFMSENKWGILPNNKWNKQYATNYDVLQMMKEKRPNPTGRPGGRFNYCNTNFVMLALIIEKISGSPFPEYMRKQIFEPLQMTNTYVYTLKDSLTATPTFTNNNTYWNYDFLDATYGDKNVYTTPRDLLKWDQALYTDQLLNNAWLDSAFKGYSFEKPSVHNYGLGFRLILLPNGKKVVYHFGKWHGSNAVFARLIDEKATIIIIGNKFTRAIYDAGSRSYQLFGPYQQQKDAESDEIDSLKVNQLREKSTPQQHQPAAKTKKK